MEENGKKQHINGKDPKTGRFTKGNKFGTGRPNGSLDFKTKWKIFIDKVAKQNNMTPEEIDEELFQIGLKKAKEGDYAFYRDLHDRLYGKPQQSIDHTTDGKEIIFQIPQVVAERFDLNDKLNEQTDGISGE